MNNDHSTGRTHSRRIGTGFMEGCSPYLGRRSGGWQPLLLELEFSRFHERTPTSLLVLTFVGRIRVWAMLQWAHPARFQATVRRNTAWRSNRGCRRLLGYMPVSRLGENISERQASSPEELPKIVVEYCCFVLQYFSLFAH